MDATQIAPTPDHLDRSWMGPLRDRLLAHAFLFDDPPAYEAGVEDTLAEVETALRGHVSGIRPAGWGRG